MSTATKLVTAEELEAMGDVPYELLQGKLIEVMSPANNLHGELANELGRQIGNHIRPEKLGKVCSAETGYLIERNPDTVLAPHIAFVHRDRLPPRSKREKILHLTPDLVAEVVSPSDRFSNVEEKVARWLAAGCKLVLVVEPRTNTVRRYTSPDRIDIFDETTNVDCSAALPGFILNTAELFEE